MELVLRIHNRRQQSQTEYYAQIFSYLWNDRISYTKHGKMIFFNSFHSAHSAHTAPPTTLSLSIFIKALFQRLRKSRNEHQLLCEWMTLFILFIHWNRKPYKRPSHFISMCCWLHLITRTQPTDRPSDTENEMAGKEKWEKFLMSCLMSRASHKKKKKITRPIWKCSATRWDFRCTHSNRAMQGREEKKNPKQSFEINHILRTSGRFAVSSLKWL